MKKPELTQLIEMWRTIIENQKILAQAINFISVAVFKKKVLEIHDSKIEQTEKPHTVLTEGD